MYLGSLKRKALEVFKPTKEIVSLKSASGHRGDVLFSYLPEPFLSNQPLKSHSNRWECFEIAQIFLNLGFAVDVISWRNEKFIPHKKYQIIFDIHNLQRFAPFVGANTLKIIHVTGSHPLQLNEAESKRVDELQRKGKKLTTYRSLGNLEAFDRSLEMADFCSLIGNAVTISTYPEAIQEKSVCVTVTALDLAYVKSSDSYTPRQKEFLWFFPNGAALRCLDLVLEVFAKNSHLKLNVVGAIEKDFLDAYSRELKGLRNVSYFGFLDVNSRKFIDISKRSFCFIAPSLSEGISSSAATCLKLGLFPILTKNIGITLPKGNGIYLEACEKSEIEAAILRAYNMNESELRGQITVCQNYALRQFSKEKFTEDMSGFIEQAINDKVGCL